MPESTPPVERSSAPHKTDIGLDRSKSERMQKAIEELFKANHVSMTPMTLLSICYSTDPPD
jgi:hypothetical protein